MTYNHQITPTYHTVLYIVGIRSIESIIIINVRYALSSGKAQKQVLLSAH